MATSADAYRCKICHTLYTDPVVHRLCGNSFDRQCIGRVCPGKNCGQVINQDDLITNYLLRKTVDEHRLLFESPPVHYYFLLDTSTSMWYSDTWLPFVTGRSRFDCAKEFLNSFFKSHMNSSTYKISLCTFDTARIERFEFETIDPKHLKMVETLKCKGKDTALFDSIDFCLDKIEQLNAIHRNQMPTSYFIILTDGYNNFGKKESDHAVKICNRTKQLQISGYTIQIGDANRKKTRIICDDLGYKFNHFNNGNVQDFVQSFSNTLKTETRARVAQIHPEEVQLLPAQATTMADESIINQLPNVPDHSIEKQRKESVLA